MLWTPAVAVVGAIAVRTFPTSSRMPFRIPDFRAMGVALGTGDPPDRCSVPYYPDRCYRPGSSALRRRLTRTVATRFFRVETAIAHLRRTVGVTRDGSPLKRCIRFRSHPLKDGLEDQPRHPSRDSTGKAFATPGLLICRTSAPSATANRQFPRNSVNSGAWSIGRLHPSDGEAG